MSAIGIEDIGAYFGTAYVSVDELFEARGLERARLANLLMRRKSVALPCEDIVTMAVNAARPMLDRLGEDGRATVETVVVATESGVDLAKSAAAFAHAFLDLPKTCRVFEVKQACHGGGAAFQMAAASLAASPRRGRALVIAGDAPIPVQGSYAEPSQGAGAVAVLLGEPRLAHWHASRYGSWSFDNNDFRRPTVDTDIINIDLSIMSYIDCLIGSYRNYSEHTPSDFSTSFDALAMHTPFPGMVRGAHRTAARRLSGLDAHGIELDFKQRVAASLEVPAEVGNIYSGCTMMALASSLRHHSTPTGHELGVYSYGGGCSSEFIGLTAAADTEHTPAAEQLDVALSARTKISVERYDVVLEAARRTLPGTPDAGGCLDGVGDLVTAAARGTGPLLMLDSIDGHHRNYLWCGKDMT